MSPLNGFQWIVRFCLLPPRHSAVLTIPRNESASYKSSGRIRDEVTRAL